jgi:sigma-B regulation protein RsbU (phosphoserine phosphatase)
MGEISFKPGDMLVLYTDGLSEAMDNHDVEYGEERLIENIVKLRTQPAEIICSMIVKSVKQYASGINDFDDMTIVVIRTRE